MIGIGVIPFQTRIASKGMDAIFYNTSPLIKIPGISKRMNTPLMHILLKVKSGINTESPKGTFEKNNHLHEHQDVKGYATYVFEHEYTATTFFCIR